MPCASLQKPGQGLMFVDGAVSINPLQGCLDDALLHVRAKTLNLVLAGHKRRRRAGRRPVSLTMHPVQSVTGTVGIA